MKTRTGRKRRRPKVRPIGGVSILFGAESRGTLATPKHRALQRARVLSIFSAL
jgi:hypothetical protein